MLCLAPAVSLTCTSCGDDDDPYIAPDDDDDDDNTSTAIQITDSMAQSVWSQYLTSTFADTDETVPGSETAAYYDDYSENWLLDDDGEGIEATRDVQIVFSGNTAQVTFVDDKAKTQRYVHITTDGAHVTIHNDSVEAGEAAGRGRMNYILSGTTTDGSVRIYSNKKFMLTLDGLSLSNPKGAAINVQKSFEKKRVFINLAEGTTNTLEDAATYTDTIAGEDDKAALFSEGKMIFMGKGQLSVTGNCNHAIAADDRIHFHSGVSVRVLNAVKDGIHAKDEVVISGGQITTFAQKDALQCDSVAGGLIMRGGRLLAAGRRAVTSGQFTYSGGSFCLVGNSTDTPTDGNQFRLIDLEDYQIAVGE